MEQLNIQASEANQRVDKFLAKYLKEAPKSFIYKMLRKKNIKLNGKRCQGNEMLQSGDVLTLFLAEETVKKFRGEIVPVPKVAGRLDIIYENEDVLFINKPAGILSQKAQKDDVSMVELVQAYVAEKSGEQRAFSAGVCNRLDRNTSGLMVAGKTLRGLQTMSEMIKGRTVHKYYLAAVAGQIDKDGVLKGYLEKDEKTNQVRVVAQAGPGRSEIHTEFQVMAKNKENTLLKVNLITGKTHQIRAHLASIGHPILGDSKYGFRKINEQYRSEYGVRRQMLHAYEMVFPQMTGELADLNQRKIVAPLPKDMKNLVDGCFPQCHL